MTWSEFFSSQSFGVIIGTVIAGVFSYFTMRTQLAYQRQFEADTYNRNKRNETYLAIIKFFQRLLDVDFNRMLRSYDENIINEYERTKALVYMYASQEIKDIFPIFKQCFDTDYFTGTYTKEELQDAFNLMQIQIFVELESSKKPKGILKCLKR